MGMYDSFYFAKGVLPDNAEAPKHEFQTKSLNNDMDVYRVCEHGFVKKYGHFYDYDGLVWDEDCLESGQINDTAVVYSYSDDPKMTHYQEYKIIILNSKIVYAEKTVDRRKDI